MHPDLTAAIERLHCMAYERDGLLYACEQLLATGMRHTCFDGETRKAVYSIELTVALINGHPVPTFYPNTEII